MKIITTLLFTLSVFACGYAKQTAKTGKWTVNKIHLQGDEKFDYLFSDDVSNRLYVSHGSIVQVVDEVKGVLAGTITGMNGVHGIAIAQGLGKGFITSGKDSSVTVFDTKTLGVITRMKITGVGPDAILFDPFSQKVFVYNGKSNNATVIDAKTNKIVATITLPGKPEFSVTDGKGKVYVNMEDKSEIVLINATTNAVEQVWPLAPGEEPSGLALDNESHRLFSACGNKLMVVVNALTGKVITTLPIGGNTDGAAFDPALKLAYSSNGDSTMTIIKSDESGKFTIVDNLKTQSGAKTIAVNKLTHHVYLSAASYEAPKDGQKPKIIPGSFVVLEIIPD